MKFIPHQSLNEKYLQKAHSAFIDQKYNLALKLYDKLLDFDKLNESALFHKAKVLTHLEKFDEARTILENQVKRLPSIEAYSIIANIQQSTLKHDDAINTFKKLIKERPEDPEYWLKLGMNQSQSYKDYKDAKFSIDKSFSLVKKNKKNDVKFLTEIADTYRLAGFFYKASEVYEFISKKTKTVEPVYYIYWGLCLKYSGKNKESRQVLTTALQYCIDISKNASSIESHTIQILAAWIYHILGNKRKAGELYSIISDNISPKDLYTDGPDTYLPSSYNRILKMREIVKGRDVAVMLYGPSIKEFKKNIEEFNKFNLCYASLNKFNELENNILPEGKNIDILTVTNPSDLNYRWEAYKQFLKSKNKNFLISSQYSFLGLNSKYGLMESIVKEFDEKLLFINSNLFVPSIATPLHFLPGNTLSVLLPVICLAAPKRIFIFGADGGNSGFEKKDESSKELYFFGGVTGQSDCNDTKNEANRRLINDAKFFDDITKFQMMAVSKLFGLSVPEVYNCCPHSSYESFTKITCEDALNILKEE
ncbi:MAG: hypothetical protein CMM49_06355 [Rhodospirillaceae bacterium]|nr:hypothetical protein [Rhodospirillaceae bacterium]|tara:strand:+ start:14575 stop:16182 length:1608 start_codon:yes stop_codon:yes gene_type:complete